MQSVSDSRIQNQIISTPQRSYGNREPASNAVKMPLCTNTATLAEDVVTLSNDRTSALSVKKEPSSPVTNAESKALRDVFSVYA